MSRRNKQANVGQVTEEVKAAATQEAAAEVQESATPEAAAEPTVQFDSWYALRSSVIPAVHKKEILKADFKGRKVPMKATMAEFDLALKKYGVELD